MDAQETYLLRNSGNAEGRFNLTVPEPFAVTPRDGSLAAGQAMQIVFSFVPEAMGTFVEELVISYDTGERCFTRLTGTAADVDVSLDRSLLQLPPCYISLVSQEAFAFCSLCAFALVTRLFRIADQWRSS